MNWGRRGNEGGNRVLECVGLIALETRGLGYDQIAHGRSPLRKLRWERVVVHVGKAERLKLVGGPFEELSGFWCFKKLGGDEGCRIELLLNFQLKGMRSLLGASLFGSPFARVFTGAADRMVDAFCERANALLS